MKVLEYLTENWDSYIITKNTSYVYHFKVRNFPIAETDYCFIGINILYQKIWYYNRDHTNNRVAFKIPETEMEYILLKLI